MQVDNRRSIIVYDIESYPNLFFIGTRVYHRVTPDSPYIEVPDSTNIWFIGDEEAFAEYCDNTKDCLWIGFNNSGYDDLMIIRYLNGGAYRETTNSIHKAMMNKEVSDWFMEHFATKGDLVYDPFMGSGTTALSALKHGRDYIGSEISEVYWKFALERIKENNIKSSTLDFVNW